MMQMYRSMGRRGGYLLTGANGKKIIQPNVRKRIREKLLEAFENDADTKT